MPPKNIVPVIIASEDSASRVTSITHGPVLASGVVIVLALNPTRTAAAWNVSLSHIRAPSLLDTARASVNARTHLPVTTAASSRRASVSQVWPVGRRTEPEAL